MPEMTLAEITAAVGGELHHSPYAPALGVIGHYHFDTRLVTEPGTLFFALKSEQGDGHQYVAGLGQKEAAAVVGPDFDFSGLRFPVIRTTDPLKAAHQLAAYVRKKYRNIHYIAVTGSAGKTTTKEFIYQLLAYKYPVYRSYKNWNNWIGMPFSLLNITGNEHAAVFELAMSYPGIGEIDALAKILRPDSAILLNALPAHLEFLKTVENVATAKAEILNYLAADDIAFINGDLPCVRHAAEPKPGRKVRFGGDCATNDIRLKQILRRDSGDVCTTMITDWFGVEARFDTPFINRVHVENLFAAIIVAHHAGMKHEEIREAVRHLKPLTGRGEIQHINHVTIIDETYNSNPEALKKAMTWVDAEFSVKKIVVAGDMLELGADEAIYHEEVGRYFARLGYDHLLVVGSRAEHIARGARENGFPGEKIHHFADAADAGRFLRSLTVPGCVILFKASRGIRLEKAIQEFIHA